MFNRVSSSDKYALYIQRIHISRVLFIYVRYSVDNVKVRPCGVDVGNGDVALNDSVDSEHEVLAYKVLGRVVCGAPLCSL